MVILRIIKKKGLLVKKRSNRNNMINSKKNPKTLVNIVGLENIAIEI